MTCTEGQPCEDPGKRQWSTRPGGGLCEGPALPHPDVGIQPPGLGENKRLSFEPPGLWHFVAAAQETSPGTGCTRETAGCCPLTHWADTRFRVSRSQQSFSAGCANQLPAPQTDRQEQGMDGRPLRSKQSAGAAEGQGLLWTVVVSSLCPLCLKCRTNTASANSGC